MKITLVIAFVLFVCISPLDTAIRTIPEESKQMKYTEVVVEVTAYTASIEECGRSDGITASGVKAVEGVTIAADDLPFGTVALIDGKEYVVQDRFGGGHTNKIDIYMNDKTEALKFGRRTMVIKILEDD